MLEKAKTKNRIDNFQTNQKYKNAFLKSKKEKKAKKKSMATERRSHESLPYKDGRISQNIATITMIKLLICLLKYRALQTRD